MFKFHSAQLVSLICLACIRYFVLIVAAQNACQLAKALAIVASEEEHTVLKQVMSRLSSVEESVQQICEEQADSDFFTFSELLKDYLSLISAVKVLLYVTELLSFS